MFERGVRECQSYDSPHSHALLYRMLTRASRSNTPTQIHLHALKAVETKHRIEIIIRQLISNSTNRELKSICRVTKVTSTGKIKDTTLRLRAKFGDDTSQQSMKEGDLTRANYTLEWPSNHMFKRDHCIHMSRVLEIGRGVGNHAPDVLHVRRTIFHTSHTKKHTLIRYCIIHRYFELIRNIETSYHFSFGLNFVISTTHRRVDVSLRKINKV